MELLIWNECVSFVGDQNDPCDVARWIAKAIKVNYIIVMYRSSNLAKICIIIEGYQQNPCIIWQSV